MRRDWPAVALVILLPAADLWWNLAHLNIGLVDFYGLSAFAAGFALHGAWPATPYFPAGYPLLLLPWGWLGSTLVGGYVLSALGSMLALYFAWLLARELGVERGIALAAIVLCWAAPVCRVVAGSPSVDALYTGLGLWFIASALIFWRSGHGAAAVGQGGLPRWAMWGLLLPSLLLPLLRYHAAVLLLPALLVLAYTSRLARCVLLALVSVVAAIGFNYASYSLAFHEPLPSAAQLQVATGLEQRYHKLYGDDDALWESYAQFAQRLEYTALTQIYRPSEIAGHWLRSWAMFLRQPAVLLLGLLLLAAIAARRQLPRGAVLGLLWLLAYTAVLAAAYYTARAAALPVMLAVTLCMWMSSYLASGGGRRWLAPAVVGLLCAGYFAAGSFALQDYGVRAAFARRSRWLDRYALQHGLKRREIAVADWRLLPLRDNPWSAPYATLSNSWLSDPRIHPAQSATIERAHQVDLLSPADPRRCLAAIDLGREDDWLMALQQQVEGCTQWREVAREDTVIILAPDRSFIPVAGADQAAP